MKYKVKNGIIYYGEEPSDTDLMNPRMNDYTRCIWSTNSTPNSPLLKN